MKESLSNCPVCAGEMMISEYACPECGTRIRGRFSRCDICSLPEDLLHFIRIFLACEGSIKEVERELGLSYPTVKARLAKIKQILDLGRFSRLLEKESRLELLRDFKEGTVSLEDVLDRLEESGGKT